MIGRLRNWARAVKRDAHALYFAARDPRVPWPAKALGVFIAAYALSPIDLIPDFIPVLGYLDDVLILPACIWLAVRMVPPALMAEHRATADAAAEKPVSRIAATMIVALWLSTASLLVWLLAARLT